MKNHVQKLRLIFIFLVMSISGAAQADTNFFISAAGNFSINLPNQFSTVKDFPADERITGGKHFTWEMPDDNFYQVQFSNISSPNKTLTIKEKNLQITTLRDGLRNFAAEKNYGFSEKPFAFQGNPGGKEIEMTHPGAISITRIFVVNKKLYAVATLVYDLDGQIKALEVLNSFKILDPKTRLALRVEEATPPLLPQSPVAEKSKSDAQDRNLKGKVKSIIEDNQFGNRKRERYGEEYYDEKGNLVKEISYMGGYPELITVWGYIDKNRVSNSKFVEYDDDERPLMQDIIMQIIESDADTENLPRDERYGTKYIYKYNENGQLVEQSNFANNGKLSEKIVYKYQTNRREQINYHSDGSEMSRILEILDKDGNVIEKADYDETGKVSSRYIYKYEPDAQGNWIVQRSFEEKKVKGKTVLQPLWVSYRTISYY